jgi:hypothetical protein
MGRPIYGFGLFHFFLFRVFLAGFKVCWLGSWFPPFSVLFSLFLDFFYLNIVRIRLLFKIDSCSNSHDFFRFLFFLFKFNFCSNQILFIYEIYTNLNFV